MTIVKTGGRVEPDLRGLDARRKRTLHRLAARVVEQLDNLSEALEQGDPTIG